MKRALSLRSGATVTAIIIVLIALVAGIGFAATGAYAETNRIAETKIAHVSDTHIMPQAYSNIYSAEFISDSGSTKLLAQSEAALATALGEIYEMEDAPTIVLISGDLTSNGEYYAHERLAHYLTELTEKMRGRKGYEKFQVFVMPGNHDTYNDRAVSYMPTEEELASCATDEERLALMENYSPRSVSTTTSIDIFEIYSDFGYCNCDGRKEGKHDAGCNIAQGTKINFFYESEYWFDNKTKRTNTSDGVKYEGFDTRPATEAEMQAYEDNNLDFEYLADAGRIGICSYVATLDGVTVIGVDGNAREYTGETETVAQKTADGWNETTGGMATRAQLRWIVDETKEEVEAGNLMLVNCHYNNIPHFESQDEVISLFVLDNLELFTSTLANAGIRYAFTGHQHAFDITDAVTQEGSVMYDIETGSLVSYGAGYRIVDFKQEWKNGDYYEEVKSTVHSLANNGKNNDGFYYGVYKLTSELAAGEEALTVNAAKPDVFSADSVNLYEGTDYLTLVSDCFTDADGNKIGIGDYLAVGLGKMITFDGLIGELVNDGLYDMLRGLLGGFTADKKFLNALLGNLIDGLSKADLPAFVDNGDGTFSMTEKAVKGNGLVNVATDLVTWLLEYDFSYGQNKEGTTLSDILVDVYGGHLSGAHGTEISDTIKPLIEKLYDGTFVDFLISTLVESIIPELDYIFDMPIRFDTKTPELAEGEGFDITEALKTSSSGAFSIDGIIKSILNNYCLKTTDKDGYSSLKYVIKDLSLVLVDLLVKPVEEIEDATMKTLAPIVRSLVSGLGSIGEYIEMAVDYINKYLEDGKLYNVLKAELLDKYVTDAFCRNLGDYAAYIVTGMDADDTPDGSHWGTGDRMTKYTVVNEENFNIATTKSNAEKLFKGKAYYRAKGTDGKLAVEPSAENGLLASMVSVSFNGDLTSGKKIRWYTSIEQNVFDKNKDGEYEYSVPESYIEYSENADMSEAKTVKATSVNVDRELPTIDFGILYINMSHRYKFYNQHTVNLTELKEGTTYYYRLGNDKYGWTEVYEFSTGTDGEFRFMAMTDVQGSVESNYINSLPSFETALKHFGEEGVSFIASMGDNVDNGKNIMQFTWWLDAQRKIWANNTLVTTAGNHEDEEYALSSVLAIPDEAKVNETGYYYSYDYGYAHFVVLDTNDLEGNNLSEAQTKWLTDDLAANAENEKIKWTIVMLHKGPYTAGSHAFDADVIGLRAQLTPIFADNGVDLVLQGHDHTYSVSEFIGRDGKPVEAKLSGNSYNKPEGVLYINLGTMGDKYYDYIYSSEVSIMKRTGVDEKLEKYLTDEGYLELTETPVFADIKVTKTALTIETYTIIDGETVLVDAINIKNGGVDWDALTPSQIATIVSVAVGVAVIVLLCVLGAYTRKRRTQWTK